MSLLDGVRFRLRSVLRRSQADAETLEEIEDHVRRQTRKHVVEGMPVRDAERLARIELGGVQRWREETAATRAGARLENVRGDTSFALRLLRAHPAFTIVAVLTLALGLGVGSATFAVVDGALLRPLPFPDADRLMAINLRMPTDAAGDLIDMVWSYPKFELLRDTQHAFSALALHSPETLGIDEADGTARVPGEAASAAYFAMLGARPAIGRTFSAAEDAPGGGTSVAVISDAFWRTRLGADPNVLSRAIDVGGSPRAIVGVMAPGFVGLSGDAAVWLPIGGARSATVLAEPTAHNLSMIGLRAPGISVSAAQQQVAALGAQIDAAYPDVGGHWGAAATSLNALRVAPSIRRALLLLCAAVVLLFAMIAVNLTTLFLTRGMARQGELAVRAAIGASRPRLVQQILTECVLIAAFGAAGGIALGASLTHVVAASFATAIPKLGSQTHLTRLAFSQIAFGARTAALTCAVAALLALAIGLVTALRGTQDIGADALRRRTHNIAAGNRGASVSGQIALALLLLVVAGLTVGSLQRALAVPLGFRPDHLLSVSITLDRRRIGAESPQHLWDDATRAVAALPGVSDVAFTSCAPVGDHCDGTSLTRPDHAAAVRAEYHEVSAGYFRTLGTPILRGREFDATDQPGSDRVMIVNRAAARAIWGADDPLRAPLMNGGRPIRVVGIVGDIRFEDLERPAEPAVFFAATQTGLTHGTMVLRTTVDPASLASSVVRTLHGVGRGHALGAARTVPAQVRDATARDRFVAVLVTIFAAAALLLAVMGVYGALSLSVAQRGRELAVRRALGADRRALVTMVLRQAVRIAGTGALLGLAAAWLMSRGVAAFLYEARPLDPRIYALSAALLAAAVAAAAAIPSVRSMRADPRDAMRAE